MTADTTANHFKDSLLTAILDDFDNLTTSAGTVVSPPARSRSGLASLPTRRTVAVVSTGAAAAALAVVGVTALSAHTSHRSTTYARGAASQSASTPPKIVTAAYVVNHLQAAVDTNAGWVLETLQHAPNSQTGQPTYSENWASNVGDSTRSEALDEQGNPTTGTVLTTTPNQTTAITINYENHTWSTTTYPFGSSGSSGPAPLPETPAQQAAQLQAGVATGMVSLVGPTTIDGQNAVELEEGTVQAGMQYVWVDPTTYLPIRELDTASGVSSTSDQGIRDDYEWLPATPANLQLLTASAAIPAGFRQVATADDSTSGQ
jgi:hypothetical protein